MSTITTTTCPYVPDVPAAEGNGRIIGKIDLPKQHEQSSVVWLSCSVPACTSREFREHEAIVPNLEFVSSKVGKLEVTADNVCAFVVCRYHANMLEDRGIRCYLLRKTLGFLERQVEDTKGLEAFLGDYDPKAPPRQEATPAEPRGRDFDSPAAKKPVGRRDGKGGKNSRGWADRD